MALTPAQDGAALRGQSVSVRSVWRRYGPVAAVQGVSLEVQAGEFVSLLGPSGSGKTTLLMMLAGFEQPQSGSILVGARDITRVAPNKRDVAMVFQRYALFPHMTVAQNIAFPLRARGVGRAEQAVRVRRALEMVRLADLADRRPAQLSGGQQQRVALARAIVFEPPVILMDEPLGALDKKLRHHMQIEIKQLQQQLGATVVYVTHDQDEALTMSDRVAVMEGGRIVQVGSPRDLYDRPANLFVAGFVGEMNVLAGRLVAREADSWRVELPGGFCMARHEAPGAQPGEAVVIAVRPERVRLSSGDEPSEPGCAVRGTLVQTVFNGASVSLLVRQPDGTMVRADRSTASPAAALPEPGSPVQLAWRPEDSHLFAPPA